MSVPTKGAPPMSLAELKRLMESVEPAPEIRACVVKWLRDDQRIVQWKPVRSTKEPYQMVTVLFIHPASEMRVRAADEHSAIRWVDASEALKGLEGFDLPALLPLPEIRLERAERPERLLFFAYRWRP